MSVSGLKIVSVYDPATGTVVQLNKIAPDGEFKKEALYTENTKGGLLYAGDDSSFEFLALDDTGFDQLETWMKNLTPVNLVTYGVEENILWYEDSTIMVKRSFGFKTGNRNGFTVKISKTGGIHNIFVGKNILSALKVWKDESPVNGMADGVTFYIPSGAYTKSFADKKQTVSVTAKGECYIAVIFNYPIAGVDLNGFVLATSPRNFNIKFEFQSFVSSTLASGSTTSDLILSKKTPSNIYKVNFYAAEGMANIENGESITLDLPFIGSPINSRVLIEY